MSSPIKEFYENMILPLDKGRFIGYTLHRMRKRRTKSERDTHANRKFDFCKHHCPTLVSNGVVVVMNCKLCSCVKRAKALSSCIMKGIKHNVKDREHQESIVDTGAKG